VYLIDVGSSFGTWEGGRQLRVRRLTERMSFQLSQVATLRWEPVR
jgi:hypothetical protein